MQTHSRYADARREAIIAQLALMGAPEGLIARVYGSTTTEAAMEEIRAEGFHGVWGRLTDAAVGYCEARIRGAAEIDVAFLDGDQVLGVSERMRTDESRWQKGGVSSGTNGD